MKFLDKLALNRLVAIILNFVLSVIKIISPKLKDELEENVPSKPRWIPPWRRGKK